MKACPCKGLYPYEFSQKIIRTAKPPGSPRPRIFSHIFFCQQPGLSGLLIPFQQPVIIAVYLSAVNAALPSVIAEYVLQPILCKSLPEIHDGFSVQVFTRSSYSRPSQSLSTASQMVRLPPGGPHRGPAVPSPYYL